MGTFISLLIFNLIMLLVPTVTFTTVRLGMLNWREP